MKSRVTCKLKLILSYSKRKSLSRYPKYPKFFLVAFSSMGKFLSGALYES